MSLIRTIITIFLITSANCNLIYSVDSQVHKTAVHSKIMFIDFQQIYNQKPGYRASLEITDWAKRWEDFHLYRQATLNRIYSKINTLSKDQQEQQHRALAQKEDAFYARQENEKENFKKKLANIIEVVARKHQIAALIAIDRRNAFCFDESYNITNEVVEAFNQEYTSRTKDQAVK